MSVLLSVLLAIHILSAVVWVGGMFFALVVLSPALKVLDAQPRLQLQMLTLKRFFLAVWHAMPLMLLTGWGMIGAAGWNFAALPWYVNAMQGLALLMAGIFLWAFLGPYRRLRRAIRPGPEIVSRIRLLMSVNLGLGIVVIVFGSLGQSW